MPRSPWLWKTPPPTSTSPPFTKVCELLDDCIDCHIEDQRDIADVGLAAILRDPQPGSLEGVSHEHRPPMSCLVCRGPQLPTCGTCTRRARTRRYEEALVQVREGASLHAAARSSGLRHRTLSRLLHRPQGKILNRAIRDRIEELVTADPELSFSEIARRADPPFPSGANVSRLLGRVRTPAKHVNGRTYPARFST